MRRFPNAPLVFAFHNSPVLTRARGKALCACVNSTQVYAHAREICMHCVRCRLAKLEANLKAPLLFEHESERLMDSTV